MRGSRAKSIRKYAADHPSKIKTGFFNGMWIVGGARRTYRDLKRKWRMKGLRP
jgi:hypothetical protein